MTRLFFLLLLASIPLGPLAGQIPILVSESAGFDRVNEPVTLGVPFPQGQIKELTGLGIRSPQNQIEDAQFDVMSRWRDGSIRWLKVDFQADVPAFTTETYQLELSTPSLGIGGIEVFEDANQIAVNTGRILFSVSKQAFNLFDEVFLDLDRNGNYESNEQIVVPKSSAGPVAVQDGIEYLASTREPERIVVEEAGGQRVVIKVEGRHWTPSGEFFLKYETRIYAYAGQPFVRVRHSYANGRSVDNLGNSGSEEFREQIDLYELDVQLNLNDDPTLYTAIDGSFLISPLVGTGGQVIQEDRPIVDTPFQAVVTNAGLEIQTGARADGWAGVSDGQKGMMVAARHFWEKYPKGFRFDLDGRVAVQPIPEGSEEHLWLSMGTGDEFLFYFFHDDETADLADFAAMHSRQPLLVRTTPEQYIESEAFYALDNCYPEEWPAMDAYTNQVTNNHLANREDLDLYGNIHFGDVPRDQFELAPARGLSTWGNNYYDCILTSARLFTQTSDQRFFDIMLPMAWHFMETQTYQTYDPDNWMNGYSPAYSQHHRSVDHYNQHYGEGIWYYYYLTGDERAKEIGLRGARSIRDRHVWGLDNPNARLAYQNASALLEAWKATGDVSFLEVARTYILDRILATQNQYGMIGAFVTEGGPRFDGEQTFMMALFSDTVWKYLREFPEDEATRQQLLLLADFVHQYARVEPSGEDYYNFWFSPSNPGEPEPILLDAGDDFVFWNGKGLIAGLYAYAFDQSQDERYLVLAQNTIDYLWGAGYGNAFGQFAWGKASAQAMKNVIHAAGIICAAEVTDIGDVPETQEGSISLFPNPAYDLITVQEDSGLPGQYQIFNGLGQLVLRGDTQGNSTSINITELSAGAYFLRLGNQMKSFVKN